MDDQMTAWPYDGITWWQDASQTIDRMVYFPMLWMQTSVWWPVRTDGTTQEAASQNCDDVSLLLWSGRARNNAAWINRFGGQDCDCGVLRVTQGGEFRQRVFSRVEWWRCEKTNETMCTSAFSFIPYMRNSHFCRYCIVVSLKTDMQILKKMESS